MKKLNVPCSIACIDDDLVPPFVLATPGVGSNDGRRAGIVGWWSWWCGGQAPPVRLCTLVLGHRRHASVLAALILLLELLVVQRLLLLLLCHVTTMSSGSRDARGGRGHGRNVIRRGHIVATIDSVLVARRLWSIQTRLQR